MKEDKTGRKDGRKEEKTGRKDGRKKERVDGKKEKRKADLIRLLGGPVLTRGPHV